MREVCVSGTDRTAAVGDLLGERAFRIGDLLGAAGFVRSLGETAGPIARLGDALAAGHRARLASPATLGFFQVCGFEDFVSRVGVDPTRTLFTGASGTVAGGPLYEDEEVVGCTVLTRDGSRDLPDGRRLRQIAIETEFRTAAGVPVSAVTFSFLEMDA